MARRWAAAAVKGWSWMQNEPSSRRLTDRLFGSQSAVYLAAWGGQKGNNNNNNNLRGFVAQTSLSRSARPDWRQKHWPVSPWCDALIYVTLAPLLSSGREVTTGWSKQKTHKLIHKHAVLVCYLQLLMRLYKCLHSAEWFWCITLVINFIHICESKYYQKGGWKTGEEKSLLPHAFLSVNFPQSLFFSSAWNRACTLSFNPKVATGGLNTHYNQRSSNAEWNEQHTPSDPSLNEHFFLWMTLTKRLQTWK